ncbi:MAG: sensor histidine kinase [Gemmatimonadaceae bacterium]
MSIKDSYLHLVHSIEKGLRADLPAVEAEDLVASIDRALIAEARNGELVLASLRVAVVGIAFLFCMEVVAGTGISFRAEAPTLFLAVGWEVWSVALLIALSRGWYRLWLRYGAPLADAVFITLIAGAMYRVTGADVPSASTLVFGTTLCAYLALSGTLRLSRSSSQLSTGLSALVFVVLAVMIHAPISLLIGTVPLLLVLGLLGSRAPALVRRVITNEIARTAMTRRYEEARQAVQAREQVLKIVSHDLRNPLHTIAMSTELLLEGGGTEEQRKKQIAIVRRAGDRMNRLVKDLLDVAKLEAGKLAIQPRPTAVRPVLAEAEDMLRPIAADKSLRLETEVPDELPCVNADAGRLIQLLSNLVGNAVKFTPAGGRIVMRARSAGALVQLSVADTGPGIPAEQLPHIFGRFWQADPTDRRGIGLGLTISKAIVEAHGGRIWVESRVGEGTAFHFTLPVSEVVARVTAAGR